MARLKIYNLATGQWEYVSLPEHRHVGGVKKGSATVSLSGGGTLVIGGTFCEWSQIGNIVSVRWGWSVTTTGSGATTVSGVFTGCPPPINTWRFVGDRGGSGVNVIYYRVSNSGGHLGFSEMKTASDFTTITGASMASGQGYTGQATYLTSAADADDAFTGFPVA